MVADIHQGEISDFQITDSEAFVLSITKLWFMQSECSRDPDKKDRLKKGPIAQKYAHDLFEVCQQQEECYRVPPAEPDALISRLDSPDWAPALRRALGSVEFADARRLMTSTKLTTALLRKIDRRERSVLVMVEMSAFYPWPKKVKFEKKIRSELLDVVAGSLPEMSVEYARELDRELVRRIRKTALKNLNWTKIGIIAGTGAVLGFITGGLAAPYIGVAIGGTMGLSGAAALNAGLALLGGGAIATGGAGVAGGTLAISAAAGAGAASMGAAGTATHGVMGSSAVLADVVKLEVLTEYMLIRENSAPAKARMVVTQIEAKQLDLERRVQELQDQLNHAREAEGLVTRLVSVVKSQDKSIAQLKEQLADLLLSRSYLNAGSAQLKRAIAA